MLLVAPIAPAAMAASLVEFAAPGEWVEPLRPDLEAGTNSTQEGRGYYSLLYDRQYDVRGEASEQYVHLAMRVLNSDGLEDLGNVSISLDPTEQRLRLHFIRLIGKDGTTREVTRFARITELPQETELASRIYNGRYNIDISVPELRIGDVLEYAYSITTRDALYPGAFSDADSLRWSDPLHHGRLRVRYPTSMAMQERVHGMTLEPERRNDGAHEELRIELRDPPVIASEPDRPDWATLWPWIEYSNFADWASVARAVSRWYAPRANGPLFAAEVERLEALPDATSRALAALQFVQEQIRYTSISIGPGSHQPRSPEEVLAQRFGDCKDKSVLLTQLLRALGIEANVALVNTGTGARLAEKLASPYAFDHAIVRARIGEREAWVDPTGVRQQQPFLDIAPPDYRYALIVDPSTTALTPIPRPPSEAWSRHVSLEFDVSAGLDEPGKLKVTTRYRGGSADSMRASLKKSTVEERDRRYLEYYAEYYAGLETSQPSHVHDDPVTGELTTIERYTLARAFEKDDEGVERLTLYTDELHSQGSPPSNRKRLSPIAVTYPEDVTQELIVKLPESWTIKDKQFAIRNPAFLYESSVTHAGRTLTLRYHYRALDDAVAPEQVARYAADRRKLDDDLGYELTSGGGRSLSRLGDFAVAPMTALVAGLGLGLWLALARMRLADPPPRDAASDAPRGIAGWLLLPALQVAVQPVVLAFVLYAFLPSIGSAIWNGLPDLAVPAREEWVKPLFLVAIVGIAAMIPAAVMAAIQFFQARSCAPRHFILSMLGSLLVIYVLYGVYMFTGIELEEDEKVNRADFTRDFLAALLWIAYMLNSKRVHATFTRRRSPVPSDPVAAAEIPSGA